MVCYLVSRPIFEGTRRFRNGICFNLQEKEWTAPILDQGLRLALSYGPKIVEASHPFTRGSSRFTFWKVVFFRKPHDGKSPKTRELQLHFSCKIGYVLFCVCIS
jgi:hypothetical protein